MEKLISDIITYSEAVGRKPQSVLRSAIGTGWGVWDSWVAGRASPTVIVMDRIYAYMAENPPVEADQNERGAA